ncbi:MAG TPA: hypothetical protein VHW25_11840 [Steroidobacteraceae bacterium]|jgi:hypothetical protein|nr:hypothetical protein [Steroidobacteraceae bacterium]
MLTKAKLARRLRHHARRELYDDSGLEAAGTAIYSLADPRDLRLTRYIGQTSAPQRRFLQHLSTARLWLPEERPWWVKQPRLRPLYEWLRELYGQEQRLPTMVIHSWVDTAHDARLAERARIVAALADNLPLLNVERELLGRQMPLI